MRFIAGGLVFTDIAPLGVVTASLASWLLDKVREVWELTQSATGDDMVSLTAETGGASSDVRRAVVVEQTASHDSTH